MDPSQSSYYPKTYPAKGHLFRWLRYESTKACLNTGFSCYYTAVGMIAGCDVRTHNIFGYLRLFSSSR